jgi:hypothetical protein
MDEADSDAALEPFLPDWIDAAAEEARGVALGMLRERGRGAVLVGVARLDTALEVLLRAALAPPRGSDTLLHGDRPLGSFGAKVALAARLGLIDAAVEQSLHNLRRLRNGFAHSSTPVRLADPPFCDRLRDSVAQARCNPLWQPMQVILEQHMTEQTGGRDGEEDPGLQSFVLLITILVAFLETAARLLSPIRPTLSLSFEEGISRTSKTSQSSNRLPS